MIDAMWAEFRTTRLLIHTDRGTLVVTPGDLDQRGMCLPEAEGPLHVLTAWNPQGAEDSEDANRAAGLALTAELSTMAGLRRWPTSGVGADNAWTEEGWTIEGLSRAEAVALAERFDQRAIFEWRDEPGGFRLVACDGSADEPRGWRTDWLD